MAFDLRDKLQPIGRLEILNAVIATVQEYYKAFPAQDEGRSGPSGKRCGLQKGAERGKS
jgi:hypothetical protein